MTVYEAWVSGYDDYRHTVGIFTERKDAEQAAALAHGVCQAAGESRSVGVTAHEVDPPRADWRCGFYGCTVDEAGAVRDRMAYTETSIPHFTRQDDPPLDPPGRMAGLAPKPGAPANWWREADAHMESGRFAEGFGLTPEEAEANALTLIRRPT